MENILAPSILSANFADMASDFRILEKGGVKWLHVDVMDGVFVPNISLGLTVIESIRKATNLFFDVHLMIHEFGVIMQPWFDEIEEIKKLENSKKLHINIMNDIIKNVFHWE